MDGKASLPVNNQLGYSLTEVKINRGRVFNSGMCLNQAKDRAGVGRKLGSREGKRDREGEGISLIKSVAC